MKTSDYLTILMKNHEDLNYVDSLRDYFESDGYISDMIFECASNRTSIYYGDIINFAKDHFDDIAETITEFGWEGVGKDLYQAAQMCETDIISGEIFSNLSAALLIAAVDYILYKLKIEELSDNQISSLETYMEGIDSDDYMEDVRAEVNNIMEITSPDIE